MLAEDYCERCLLASDRSRRLQILRRHIPASFMRRSGNTETNECNRLFTTVRSSTSVIVRRKPLKSNLIFARNYGHEGLEGAMSKRLLAILGLVAALGLGTPALMADHGERTNTSTETSTTIGTTSMHGSAATGMSIASTPIATTVRRDGTTVKRRGGAIADCHRAKPRNMAAEPMCISSVPFTTTRMKLGGL